MIKYIPNSEIYRLCSTFTDVIMEKYDRMADKVTFRGESCQEIHIKGLQTLLGFTYDRSKDNDNKS